jgi:hypothetical protein
MNTKCFGILVLAGVLFFPNFCRGYYNGIHTGTALRNSGGDYDKYNHYLTTVRTSCTKITVTTSFNRDRESELFGSNVLTILNYRNRYSYS